MAQGSALSPEPEAWSRGSGARPLSSSGSATCSLLEM